MSKEDRRRTMSRIRSSGTGIERTLQELVREALPGEELVFNDSSLPGTPDVAVPDLGLVFFADGCFFHGCPEHFTMPENNRDYWAAKIERNRERDQEINAELEAHDFQVVRMWGHVIRKDRAGARRMIGRAIGERT